jgi:hypothetical protein
VRSAPCSSIVDAIVVAITDVRPSVSLMATTDFRVAACLSGWRHLSVASPIEHGLLGR